MAYGSFISVVLVGLVLPNVFLPFVLVGMLDASIPSLTLLSVWMTIILLLAFLLVLSNLIRLRRVSAICGGILIMAGLIYFFVSSTFLSTDSDYSLRAMQLRVGNVGLCLAAALVWKIACYSLSPFVHMLHYLMAALMGTSISCRMIDVVERAAPLTTLVSWAQEGDQREWVLALSVAKWLTDETWSLFGLTYERIRTGVSVANIAIVAFRYALNDRSNHVPSSPLRMAIILFSVLLSIVELVPVAPALALRLVGELIIGRPILDSFHHLGLVGALSRPGRFVQSCRMRKACAQAESYEAWLSRTRGLHQWEGREPWRSAKSAHFDMRLVARALETLNRVRTQADERGSPHDLAELLITLVNRKFANINDPHNHMYPGVGPKAAVEAYVSAVASAIEHVVTTDWTDKDWGAQRKAAFIASARHAHGCTALCLSGGGAIAMYHLGLVGALLDQGVLPSVVSGTSGGAIVAGLLACRTDEELPHFIHPDVSTRDGYRYFDDFWSMVGRLVREGVVVDKEKFLQALEPICGDLTFAEAFARTGRLVNLSTSTTSLGATLLLNHIITPNVLVRSAVQASCALTGVMRPGHLLAKNREGKIVLFESAGLLFRDGSFQSDIPMRELSAQFHATHFIVSQVNAHVAPFLYDSVAPVSLLRRMERFLVTDVRARLEKYTKAGYLAPELEKLVRQEYVGGKDDVTIFPRLRLSDLTCVLRPTRRRLSAVWLIGLFPLPLPPFNRHALRRAYPQPPRPREHEGVPHPWSAHELAAHSPHPDADANRAHTQRLRR